jgi:hypothetical protein
MKKSLSLFENPNFYDYIKHITTLSTASLVLVVTFADKFATRPLWGSLFIASVVLFLLTIVSSLVCMILVLSIQRYEEASETPKWEQKLFSRSLLGSWLFFLGGVICIAAFSIKNFGV